MFIRLFIAGMLLLGSHMVKADHIVGGELQLTHMRGNVYYVTLNFYFNDITGDPLAKDPYEYVSIFRKSDNSLMQTLNLDLESDAFIPSVNGSNCSNPSVRTRLIRYRGSIILYPPIYNDPAGYYISWERCCRNHTIDNLDKPDETGITIYLEFPPLILNNTRFINSTPVFRNMKNIYGCKGTPFYYDFSATDADGDSLVYSLITPLKGHTTKDDPALIGGSAPYDTVAWKTGYGLSNVIPGNPSLEIDAHTGMLFVKPSEAGLFVFSVVCEEYRNGHRIGLVTRDFQFLIDLCLPAFPPVMQLEKEDNTLYREGDTLTIDMNKQYCYDITVSDSTWDSLKVQEFIFYSGSGDSMPNITVTLDSSRQRINASFPKGKNRLCVSADCINGTYNYAGIYRWRIIARDSTCPLPMLDTLDIIFNILPDTNHLPVIAPAAQYANLLIGDSYSLQVYGKDKDTGDRLTLSAYGISEGMGFVNVSGHDSVSSAFTFSPSCANLDPGYYKVYFVLKDDHCLNPSSDTTSVDIHVGEIIHPFTFNAPNLITANGDGYNQYFEIPDLPEDYCENYFVKVEIYNRWGAKVFESDNRDFKWNAGEAGAGIYYYAVIYSSRQYRSWVEVMK